MSLLRRVGLCLALSSYIGTRMATAQTLPVDDERRVVDPTIVTTETLKDRDGWIAVPVVGFSPETSLQLGVLVIYFFDLEKNSSLSSLPVLGIGTLKEQFIIEVRPELFFDHDNYRVWTRFDFRRFPDSFFGVGNQVRDQDREPYQREFARLRTNLRRRLVGDLHLGILSDHEKMSLSYERDDGLFATRDYVGEGGGFTAGFGITAAYDSRDHKNYPTRGFLLEASVVPFLSAFGSDYNYIQSVVDARAYLPLGHQQLLAFQYYLETTDGDVPFYRLPQLGGPDLLRGYFLGKYREESLHALQAEYRAHLVWKLRAAAFAGVGQVGEDYGSMWTAPLRPTFGGGLRYNMKTPSDIVNFRVDVGWAPLTGEAGLYVAATEAF